MMLYFKVGRVRCSIFVTLHCQVPRCDISWRRWFYADDWWWGQLLDTRKPACSWTIHSRYQVNKSHSVDWFSVSASTFSVNGCFNCCC